MTSFSWDQDQLEEVLDVALATQRFVLAERHAQRKFLVHSLHSLNGLVADSFSSASSGLSGWFSHIRRSELTGATAVWPSHGTTPLNTIILQDECTFL